jgi:hypothetical protein
MSANSSRRSPLSGSGKPDLTPTEGPVDLGYTGQFVDAVDSVPTAGDVGGGRAVMVDPFADATDAQRAAIAAILAGQQAPAPGPDPDKGFMYVMDQSATPNSGNRVHHLRIKGGVLKAFEFAAGVPLRMEFAFAMQFLKNEGFLQTDSNGEVVEFKRAPKRPEDLEAGEKLTLSETQTIAELDELVNSALIKRAAIIPGSEAVIRTGPREAIIEFMVTHYRTTKALNSQKDDALDANLEEFDPGEIDDAEFGPIEMA